MTFKEMRIADLAVIYNTAEFAKEATYKGNKISFFYRKDIEVESIKEKVIKTIASNVPSLKIGDIFTIDGSDYKCLIFDDEEDFQINIVISKI